jgi:hypothetical protein
VVVNRPGIVIGIVVIAVITVTGAIVVRAVGILVTVVIFIIQVTPPAVVDAHGDPVIEVTGSGGFGTFFVLPVIPVPAVIIGPYG